MSYLEELQKKLKSLGFNEEKIAAVIEEMFELINRKVLADYFSRLNEDQLNLIKSVPESKVIKLIEDNKEKFPPISREEFDKASDEIWERYFKEMAK